MDIKIVPIVTKLSREIEHYEIILDQIRKNSTVVLKASMTGCYDFHIDTLDADTKKVLIESYQDRIDKLKKELEEI